MVAGNRTAQARRRNFAQPRLTGSQEIAGKTILLHAEQGFGDTIQFCRYAPRIAALGGRAILEVQRPLHDLMQYASRRGADRIERRAVAGFRYALPNAQPAVGVRHGARDDPARDALSACIRASGGELERAAAAKNASAHRLGLVWPAGAQQRSNRSIDLGSFLSPLEGIDATLVSLQREVRAADAVVLQERSDVIHFGEELKDFSDTAALAANMDLVISVDTSVAHLAGALAKPVWVLLPFIPDWRWLLDRDDSPWYPTARLFRQDDSRRWDSVFARLRAALDDFLHRK